MTGKDEIKRGILEYVDAEILPSLPTSGKWALGSAVVLATPKFDELYEQIKCSSYIKALGIVNKKGDMDVHKCATALRSSAKKYGKLSISIPIIGTLTFNEDDIAKLENYICGGSDHGDDTDS